MEIENANSLYEGELPLPLFQSLTEHIQVVFPVIRAPDGDRVAPVVIEKYGPGIPIHRRFN